MENLKSQAIKELDEHTKICSDVCRQIVFGLFALIWVISFKDGVITFTKGAYVSFIFLSIYVTFDIAQYLSVALSSRKHLKKILEAEQDDFKTIDESRLDVKKDKSRINKRAYYFFVTKLITLILIILSVIFALYEKAFLQ